MMSPLASLRRNAFTQDDTATQQETTPFFLPGSSKQNATESVIPRMIPTAEKWLAAYIAGVIFVTRQPSGPMTPKTADFFGEPRTAALSKKWSSHSQNELLR